MKKTPLIFILGFIAFAIILPAAAAGRGVRKWERRRNEPDIT